MYNIFLKHVCINLINISINSHRNHFFEVINTFWAIKTALLIIVKVTIHLLNLFLLSTWNGVSFDQHPVSWVPQGTCGTLGELPLLDLLYM